MHLAADNLPPIGIGLLALEAARAAHQGASVEEIVAQVNDQATRTYLAFVVPTLEYLRRGGRIGGAQAFLGSLLNVKPILHVDDGRVEPVTRVRSFGKARRALMSYMQGHAPNGVTSAAVLHVDAEEMRAALEAEVRSEYQPTADLLPNIEMGPVIATHTGRGAFGLSFIANA